MFTCSGPLSNTSSDNMSGTQEKKLDWRLKYRESWLLSIDVLYNHDEYASSTNRLRPETIMGLLPDT